MRSFAGCLVLLGPLFLSASHLTAQGFPNIAGDWTMMTTAAMPDEELPCEFEGGATVSQNGSSVMGTASLTLMSGPIPCPAEMMADVMGTLGSGGPGTLVRDVDLGTAGTSFSGTLMGGTLGIATFNGMVSGNGMSITMDNTVPDPNGPFAGTLTSWSALLQAGAAPAQGVPTLGQWGLVLLVALLLLASLGLMRRSEAA